MPGGHFHKRLHVGQYLLHQELVGGVGGAGALGATGVAGGLTNVDFPQCKSTIMSGLAPVVHKHRTATEGGPRQYVSMQTNSHYSFMLTDSH